MPEQGVEPIKEQGGQSFPEGNTKKSTLFCRALPFECKVSHCIWRQDHKTDPGLFYSLKQTQTFGQGTLNFKGHFYSGAETHFQKLNFHQSNMTTLVFVPHLHKDVHITSVRKLRKLQEGCDLTEKNPVAKKLFWGKETRRMLHGKPVRLPARSPPVA